MDDPMLAGGLLLYPDEPTVTVIINPNLKKPISQTKIALYRSLLSIKEPTENEIDLMFCLAKDDDIQDTLRESTKKEPS
jgi:dihydroorotase